MSRALLSAPANAKRGDVIEVRALVQHPMDTGYRRGNGGELIPRSLVRTLSCRFVPSNDAATQTPAAAGGHLVFSARLHAAISANPYVAFHWRATGSGRLTVVWAGDNGFTNTASTDVVVV